MSNDHFATSNQGNRGAADPAGLGNTANPIDPIVGGVPIQAPESTLPILSPEVLRAMGDYANLASVAAAVTWDREVALALSQEMEVIDLTHLEDNHSHELHGIYEATPMVGHRRAPKPVTCGLCGQPGHNRRTCLKAIAKAEIIRDGSCLRGCDHCARERMKEYVL